MAQVYAEAAIAVAGVLNSPGGQEILKATPQLVGQTQTETFNLLKNEQKMKNELLSNASKKLLEKGGFVDVSTGQFEKLSNASRKIFEDAATNPQKYTTDIIDNHLNTIVGGIAKVNEAIKSSVSTALGVHKDVTKTAFETKEAVEKGVASSVQTGTDIAKKFLSFGFYKTQAEKDAAQLAQGRQRIEMAKLKQEEQSVSATAAGEKRGGCDKKTLGRAMLVVLVLFLIVVMYYFMYGGVNARHLTMGLGFAYIALFAYSKYAKHTSDPEPLTQ